jgi:uncharacterized protein
MPSRGARPKSSRAATAEPRRSRSSCRSTTTTARMRRSQAAELAIAGAISAYRVAALRWLPARVRIPANLVTAAAALAVARAGGAGLADLGLEPRSTGRGARVGAAVAVPVVATVAAAVAVPRTRALLADDRITEVDARTAAFETLVRIPIETALAEELIFRGALLGLGLRTRPPGAAIAVTALAFGLWHVHPTLASLSHGTEPASQRAVATSAVVVATAAAGAGLALLRLRAGSVAAPVVVHAALNMTAYAGVRALASR